MCNGQYLLNRIQSNSEIYFKRKHTPGGGGMLGGPPGIGCCCSGGGTGRPAAGNSLCSTSSHSVLKSPELNLLMENQNSNDSQSSDSFQIRLSIERGVWTFCIDVMVKR